MNENKRNPECKDCKTHREALGRPYPKAPRAIKEGTGGRCASHGRQFKALSKTNAHERNVQRTYGLKPGEYGQIYLAQGKRCAGCQRATGATRRLAVDHDHKTGLVRGLLCYNCNRALGHFRDNADALRRLAEYLDYPPAARLGIYAVHKDNRRSPDGGVA